MTKIVLSIEGCNKNQVSLGEVLMLLAYHNKIELKRVQELLIEKGYITAERDNLFQQNGWRVTRKGNELIDSVVLDSDSSEKSDADILALAEKLKEVFPAGRKDGTSNYWAEGKALIAKRLKAFFKKYGTDYTDEQIVNAARKYVESFNGNYQFMRTLKYFIFKDRDIAGEREYTSDLLNYLENAGNEEILKDDWMSTTV